jgi:flagellar motor protein MotB
VCIYSNGTTHIGACKRLWVNEFGIFSYPAVSNAVTQTCINDIQARRQIIERIAWKKVGKQKSSAENVASQHAQQRVNERIDAQASKTLDKAQQDFTNKFRQPLCDHKLFPDQLQFSTDKQSLQVVSMQIGNSRLAAPAPPPNAAKADMILRVHESMINNFTLDALGGMTVHEEKLQAAVIDMIGRLPDKLKGDEDQEPWAITFARRQPISVTFSDDGFKITIRGSEYFKGDAAYPAMDVTAIYKIEKTANGFKAVRQGEIQIFPPGRQQVGGKEQIIRQLLTKRFGKVFEPEISDDGFLFTGKLEKVGKMQPVEVQSRDGWLTIAWKRAPADQKIE